MEPQPHLLQLSKAWGFLGYILEPLRVSELFAFIVLAAAFSYVRAFNFAN